MRATGGQTHPSKGCYSHSGRPGEHSATFDSIRGGSPPAARGAMRRDPESSSKRYRKLASEGTG